MYKLFKQVRVVEFPSHNETGWGEPLWELVGSNYSVFELNNLKKKLPSGDYMLVQASEEFKVERKTFKQLCRENPVP